MNRLKGIGDKIHHNGVFAPDAKKWKNYKMALSNFDKLVLAMVGGGVVVVGAFVYSSVVPESSEKIARDAEKAEQLGFIWGESEVAESRCPGLIINSITAQQLLVGDGSLGNNGLAVMTQLAKKIEWYNAYKKGADQAQALFKSKPGDAFCKAMMDAYGPKGSRTPRLLKVRAEGEQRPKLF